MTADRTADQQLKSVLLYFKDMAMFENHELTKPESKGMDGDTPLHVVAIEGRLDFLQLLLPFVEEIDVPGDLGNSPLHCAVLWNQPDVARLLISRGADVRRANDYGDTPLELMQGRAAFSTLLSEILKTKE